MSTILHRLASAIVGNVGSPDRTPRFVDLGYASQPENGTSQIPTSIFIKALLNVVAQAPASQSGKPGSIPGASASQPSRRRGDKRQHHRQNASLLKTCGLKNQHSLRTCTGYGITFIFTLYSIIMAFVIFRLSSTNGFWLYQLQWNETRKPTKLCE